MKLHPLAILLLLASPALAGEVQEVARLAEKYGGRTEVRLRDGTRVDLLTNTHAIEADWAYKWPEAVGQSCHYALMTGKRPGIILLVKDPERDQKYIDRCRRVCDAILFGGHFQIDLWVEPVPTPDRRMNGWWRLR